MNNTPVANRLHIAIFGRRNAGKSTLINAITGQDIAVVSNIPGTTTDPVYKTMELLPLGPVVIIDTAGIDDFGDLGNLRVEKTYDVLRKTNFAIFVFDAQEGITESDKNFLLEIKSRKVSLIAVLNKSDKIKTGSPGVDEYEKELGVPVCEVSAQNRTGIDELKQLIAKHAKFDEANISIVGDLINPGDVVVLVTPIDSGAPKGRMILPQQQTIRDILDNDAIVVVTKEFQLKETLESLAKKPSLVITDSQAFSKVSAETPEDIRLTSFSILYARYKGELDQLVKGLKKIEELKDGSRVLIVEGCTHHRQEDDIGKNKIPRWIRQMSGAEIEFEWASGTYFPKDIEKFDLIVHCGGCMLNRLEMQYRINYSQQSNVAITNYGMLIASSQGILKRALEPFLSEYLQF